MPGVGVNILNAAARFAHPLPSIALTRSTACSPPACASLIPLTVSTHGAFGPAVRCMRPENGGVRPGFRDAPRHFPPDRSCEMPVSRSER